MRRAKNGADESERERRLKKRDKNEENEEKERVGEERSGSTDNKREKETASNLGGGVGEPFVTRPVAA